MKTIAVVLAAFSLIILPGCEQLFGPPSAGLDDRMGDEVPQIPQDIAEVEDEEPIITVFLHEEDRTTEMSMEEYIKGVVAAEMDPNWDENALAAQAIIARTFTLQKIQEEGGVPEREAHASTDIEEFQAYNAEEINENVSSAVENTRGLVAVHEGDFIRGWFHAYAGPRTALADEGLEFEDGNPPYIHIVESPGGDVIPPEEKDWEEAFSLEDIASAVEEITGERPDEPGEVEIVETGPSGRATTLNVDGVEVSAPEMRLALGSTEMRSTFVEEIENNGEEVVLSGTGYGHGVGMCQWGARAMAKEGTEPEEIVDYYYKNIEIVKLWE